MEIKGTIKKIGSIVNVSDKFKKREVIITTDDQYPQDIAIQFNQDNVFLIEEYKVGEQVVVGYNLKGREWTNPQGEVKYFNTIEGWRISKPSSTKSVVKESGIVANFKENMISDMANESDLPF